MNILLFADKVKIVNNNILRKLILYFIFINKIYSLYYLIIFTLIEIFNNKRDIILLLCEPGFFSTSLYLYYILCLFNRARPVILKI